MDVTFHVVRIDRDRLACERFRVLEALHAGHVTQSRVRKGGARGKRETRCGAFGGGNFGGSEIVALLELRESCVLRRMRRLKHNRGYQYDRSQAVRELAHRLRDAPLR